MNKDVVCEGNAERELIAAWDAVVAEGVVDDGAVCCFYGDAYLADGVDKVVRNVIPVRKRVSERHTGALDAAVIKDIIYGVVGDGDVFAVVCCLDADGCACGNGDVKDGVVGDSGVVRGCAERDAALESAELAVLDGNILLCAEGADGIARVWCRVVEDGESLTVEGDVTGVYGDAIGAAG